METLRWRDYLTFVSAPSIGPLVICYMSNNSFSVLIDLYGVDEYLSQLQTQFFENLITIRLSEKAKSLLVCIRAPFVCAVLSIWEYYVYANLLFSRRITSTDHNSNRNVAKELSDGSKPKLLRTTTEHNGDAKLEAAAALHVSKLDEQVRALKATGIIMEADKGALELTAKLQRATRELIKLRYGEITGRDKNFRVRMELEFQNTIPDWEEKGKDGVVVVEMGPIELIPCSVSF